jgi:hypothetical protein
MLTTIWALIKGIPAAIAAVANALAAWVGFKRDKLIEDGGKAKAERDHAYRDLERSNRGRQIDEDVRNAHDDDLDKWMRD